MSDETLIEAGFADPIFQSQAAFRAVLSALSEPGLAQAIGSEVAPPAGLSAATASTLLTLADYETPIWLPDVLRDGPAGAWLRFHCGATLVADPAAAAFAVIAGSEAEPALSAFNPGSDQFPDRSTTVIVQCAALAGGPAVTLSGPGIADTRSIAPAGLRAGFWTEIAGNSELYPCGIDLLLSHGAEIVGLPRSTQVQEA